MNKTPRVRFAPSPTGELHIGSVRAALYPFLLARHQSGTFILRLEDTDQKRLVPGSDLRIVQTLLQFGIEIDEGVMLGTDGKSLVQKGDVGPYIQSQRLDIYKKHADNLLQTEKVYYCFCSADRLTSLRESQSVAKEKIGYDGLCRSLSQDDIEQKIAQGESSVLRMLTPQSGEVSFTDLVYGEISFDYATVDDFVCIKSDGYPTYHFANVVDDHLMGITHVLRGPEWISSTPKHVALYNAFGWKPPQFGHIPLLLNPDKTKLSKRQGDVAAIDFLNKGYLPEALINFIALLGWNPRGDQEIYSMDELITEFDIAKVNKAGAVFSTEKLDWLNRHYLQTKTDDELMSLMKPYFAKKGLITPQHADAQWFKKVVQLEKERVSMLSQVGEETGFLFAPIVPSSEQLIWKKSTAADTKRVLQKLAELVKTITEANWSADSLEKTIKQWIEQHEYTNGEVLWPMRVALSGLSHSPDPFTLADIHGKAHTLSLITQAHDLL